MDIYTTAKASNIGLTYLSPSLEILSISTLLLLVLVALGVLFLGGGLAFLTTIYQFPASRSIQFLLLLPMAIPTYIMGFLLFGASKDHSVMNIIEVKDIWLPGSLFVLLKTSLLYIVTLYPIIYITTKNALSALTHAQLETCRILNLSQAGILLNILFPWVRSGISSGLMLTLLVVLSDFATPLLNGLPTLTTTIYFNLEHNQTGSIVWIPAALLFLTGLLVILILQMVRGSATQEPKVMQTDQLYQAVSQAKSKLVSLICLLVLFATLFFPLTRLILLLSRNASIDSVVNLQPYLLHSAELSLGIGILSIFVILLAVRSGGFYLTKPVMVLIKSLPVPSLVVAMLFVLQGLPALMLTYLFHVMPVIMGVLLSGSMLSTARYSVLTYAIGLSGLNKFFRIYLPMMKSDIGIVLLLVTVMIFRELPASYLLQTEGWKTLATKCFELVSAGAIELAAPAAGILILAGLLPILLIALKPSILSRTI